MMLASSDPLFGGSIDLTVVLIVIVKTLIVFAVLLVSVMFYVWFMRKVIADMQNRVGPDRAGPFGVFQTFADGVKLFFKEQSIPDSADKPVFRLAPYLAIMPAFLAFSIIPIGGLVSVAGHKTYLQLAELPVGVLWLLAMSGIGVYGVMLAGWASGSKYPLLGSVRASAQLLSYEATFGLAIIGVLVWSGTLSTRGIVLQQAGVGPGHVGALWSGWGSIGNWFVWSALVAFVLFLIAAVAETNHPPFDLVEAEQELVGGFHTEYTGIRFAIFFLAEFMNVITMSAIAVTLFLGGPSGPAIPGLAAQGVVNAWIMPVVYFTAKLLVLLFCTVWLRAALPRLRYDRLMNFGWKYLIEIAFLWVMVSAVIRFSQEANWDFVGGSTAFTSIVVAAMAAAGAGLVYLILWVCMPSADVGDFDPVGVARDLAPRGEQ
ncbi:MAG: complex I subunit 1/NuoH family protein [Acidimicrobiia bacterium]